MDKQTATDTATNNRAYFVSYCVNRQDGEPDTEEIMTSNEITELQRNAAHYGDRLEISTRPVPTRYVPHYSV